MRVLITAGPTREWLDPVRFISNPSTGKMGYLLAQLAEKRGHRVTLISGPTHLSPPEGTKFISVEAGREMEKEVLKYFPSSDILFMASAVSDWRPQRKSLKKIKKGIKKEKKLSLVKNPDILRKIGELKRKGQILVGFSIETENFVENGGKKLKEKNLDYILINSPEFFGKANKKKKVILLDETGRKRDLSSLSKSQIATFLINYTTCQT